MSQGKVSGLSWADLVKDPKKISVEVLWRLFVKQVYPTVVEGSEQYIHMRRNFYCGFLECLKFFTDVSCDFPEEVAIDTLSRIVKETNDFFEKELAGLLPKRDPSKLMG